MEYTVEIVYAGDRSSSIIEKAPTTTTIGRLKKMIQKLNSMNNASSIRVVQCGRILEDEVALGSLQLSEDGKIRVYVTGIPTKVARFRGHRPIQLTNPVQRRLRDSPLVGVGMLVCAVAVVVAFAYFSVKSQTGPNMFPERSSPKRTRRMIFVGMTLMLLGLVLAFAQKSAKVREATVVFFESALPTFDLQEFRARHEGNH